MEYMGQADMIGIDTTFRIGYGQIRSETLRVWDKVELSLKER
jgi:hypothetical protein